MAETDPYKRKKRKPAKKGILENIRAKVMKIIKKSSIKTKKKILEEEKRHPHKKKKNTDPYADNTDPYADKSSKRK